MEEELTIPEETTTEEGEEEEGEEVLISEEAFDANSLELLLQITDVWDKALSDQIGEEEAFTIIKSITSGLQQEKPTRKRRKRKRTTKQ